MVQRVLPNTRPLRSVGLAAHILAPCHLAGILAKIFAADTVVLAELGTAQASEIAFNLIGAGAIV